MWVGGVGLGSSWCLLLIVVITLIVSVCGVDCVCCFVRLLRVA